MIEFRDFKIADIESLKEKYANYFNKEENDNWTIENAERRLKQLFIREDSLGIVAIKDSIIAGFAIGQLVQFDDGLIFELNELLVFKEFQGLKIGSMLVKKQEEMAKRNGAFRIQLFSVNDEMHNHFYNVKHGYKNATNNLWKTKAL